MKCLFAPLLLVALAGFVALTSCDSEASAGQRITVTGSSTVAPLFAEIAKRFERQHPGVRVEVQTGGSSRGIADARRGIADLGMVSRALKADEDDLTAWPIARDGLCMIVHRDNPIASLDADQVRAIYRGEIDDWSELGGPARPILVVHKAEGRATLDLFLRFFDLKNTEVHPDTIVGDNEQGIKTVAGNAGAIGYVSIGAAIVHAEHYGSIRLLPDGGVAASLDAVADRRWPMLRELNVVTLGRPSGRALELLEYARSPAVHDLIRALSFVPVDR